MHMHYKQQTVKTIEHILVSKETNISRGHFQVESSAKALIQKLNKQKQITQGLG
jgi:hypothetical protein